MSRQKAPCPSCRAKGEDASGDNLSIFPDGKGGYCMKCRLYHPIKGGEVQEFDNQRSKWNGGRDTSSALDLAAIAQYPIMGWEERGISKATMERFGVRCTVDESNRKPDCFYFPYYDPDGNVTGYKRRKVASKEFSVLGKVRGLFGQQQAKSGAAFCVIVEGEIDQLSVAEMFAQRGKDWVVVSIPNGASEDGTPDKAVTREIDWITKHPRIALAYDMDPPGRASANALADMIVSRCLVKHVHMPVKDANEMLKRGMVDEFYKCLSNAREHKPDQIVMGNDGELQELVTPIEVGIDFPFMPKTCAKLKGFRTREITTFLAPPNLGKSSLMRQMMYHILSTTDEEVGAFYLEETVAKSKQSVLAYHANVPLNKFRQDPSCADPRLVQEAYETLLPRLNLFEHKGRMISDDLIERKIEYMVQAKGCKTIFLDHLSFIISGREGGDERRGIDNLMTRLARSVEDLNYRLFMVSHIKRGEKEQSRKNSAQKYPYWEVLGMSEGRGSGAIEQLSHTLISMEKQVLDPEEDNTRGLLRTRINRAREWGLVGVADYLTMDSTGKFTPVEVSY